MIKGIRRGVISIVCALLLVVPFSFSVKAEEADDVGYIAAQQFFAKYNLQRYESNPHQIICTASGSTTSCNITAGNSNNVGHWYHTMNIPAGLSFNTYSAYSTANRFRTTAEPLYIVFLSSTNFTDANSTVYPQSGYNVSFQRVTNNYQTLMTPDGFYLITFKITATSYPSGGTVWATLNMPGTSSTTIIPIYKGAADTMPDNVHRLVFGTGQTFNTFDSITHNYLSVLNDRMNTNNSKLDTLHTDLTNIYARQQLILNETSAIRGTLGDAYQTIWQPQYNSVLRIESIITSGNNASNSAGNNLDNKTSDLNSVTSTLSNFESSLNTDLTTQMNQIDFNTSGSIISNNNFLLSSNWVRTQYNRMISNNPFGSMISFSLVIGISLLVIGKLRK